MSLFFGWLLPLILVVLEAIFVRKCVQKRNGDPLPRFWVWISVIAALCPVAGWIIFGVWIVLLIMGLSEPYSSWTFIDNRFIRFWFKS